LSKYGLLKTEEISDYVSRVYLSKSISEAVQHSVYIQESGPEDLCTKKKLTHNIDQLAPKNIPICSSTSGIPASLYANEVFAKNRCLVAHPINPPHLILAVETVPAPFTDASIVDSVKEIILSLNQAPLELKKGKYQGL
jgi:3-hydroxyacyl-CoA dehydrogenase